MEVLDIQIFKKETKIGGKGFITKSIRPGGAKSLGGGVEDRFKREKKNLEA